MARQGGLVGPPGWARWPSRVGLLAQQGVGPRPAGSSALPACARVWARPAREPVQAPLPEALPAPLPRPPALQGRWLLWGWLQERRKMGSYNYAGCLTLPRVLLCTEDGRLVQVGLGVAMVQGNRPACCTGGAVTRALRGPPFPHLSCVPPPALPPNPPISWDPTPPCTCNVIV